MENAADEFITIIRNDHPEIPDEQFEELGKLAMVAAKAIMDQTTNSSRTKHTLVNLMTLAAYAHLAHCEIEGIDPLVRGDDNGSSTVH